MVDSAPSTAGAWLGVDVGTQGVRAVALDDAGTLLAQAAATLAPGHRDGRSHTQDPKDWWRALCDATRAVVHDLGGIPVAGLSVDSTSGTLVVQDASGSPAAPALMYDDTEAAPYARAAQEQGEQLWSSLGYRVQPSWALPKVLLLVREGRLGVGQVLAHQGDHLLGRLVGHRVPSDTASVLKTGYDLLEERWPDEVLDALGVPSGLLPEVVRPGTPVGVVSAGGAAASGVPAGTPVMAGTTDGCAAQVAAGALAHGSWSSALGTTLVVKGSTPDLLLDPDGAVYCHRNPDGGWLPGGASSSGAGVLARDLPGRDLADLTSAVGRRYPAGFPVPGTVYPLLGRGERFPFVSPDAVPLVEPDPGPAGRDDVDVLAGAMQGVAFVERLAYDVLRGLGADTSGPVTLSGGPTRNGVWNQLRADTLGRPVRLPGSVEAAVGAALLAAAPPGRLATTAARMVRTRQVLQPDPAAGARLTEAYLGFVARLLELGWLDAGRLPAHLRDGNAAAPRAEGDA